MKKRTGLALLLTCGIASAVLAQAARPAPSPVGEVAIVSLLGAKYPPLARQARITGDVELRLAIRKDGSVESAVAVSGHPMLTEAALNSAKQSQFECGGCKDEVTVYSLTYSFQIAASPGWPCPENTGSRITQTGNRVTITSEPAMLDPYFVNIRVRSAKCLYLWSCGSSWGGKDYYFYRVRSAKCLGLWNCGYRLREPFATCQKLHRKISY